jgi:hypothetical protein
VEVEQLEQAADVLETVLTGGLTRYP